MKSIDVIGIYAFLAAAPIVAVVYLTYTTYLKNVEAAAVQVELPADVGGGAGQVAFAARAEDARPRAGEEGHVEDPRAFLVRVLETHPFVRVGRRGHGPGRDRRPVPEPPRSRRCEDPSSARSGPCSRGSRPSRPSRPCSCRSSGPGMRRGASPIRSDLRQ